MQAKDLLVRQRSDKDERVVLITLTDKGIELRKQAHDIPRNLLCRSDLQTEQVIELRENLKAMLAALT